MFQHMRHGGRAECTLPVSADAQDGALGKEGFHTHPTTPAGYATSSVSIRAQQVSSNLH